MKRFHLHLAVTDLAANIQFYSHLFGAPPSVEKGDYAKWMLDDPFINFAISARGAKPGIDHIGIQVESEAELSLLKARYDAADAAAVKTETGAACCYAESNKHWLNDPQGTPWEAFHTLIDIPTFGQNTVHGLAHTADNAACCAPAAATAAPAAACCAPKASVAPVAAVATEAAASSSCCKPKAAADGVKSSCC
jgi:catechol 2,3-dioxygenase-like lactoylglutathione lyase family enzyme